MYIVVYVYEQVLVNDKIIVSLHRHELMFTTSWTAGQIVYRPTQRTM